jgi:tetratricopeptide (TPR) repeat protein
MGDRRYSAGHNVAHLGVFILPLFPFFLTSGWADHHDYLVGWPAFIALWIWALAIHLALIALHEFGHFFAARMLGIEISDLTIGHWKKIAKVRWRGTEISIRAIPDSGYVTAVPNENLLSRWRAVLFLAAGILVEVFVVAGAAVGLATMRAGFASLLGYAAAYSLWCIVGFGAWHVVICSWPSRANVGGHILPNDAQQILDRLRKPPLDTAFLETTKTMNEAWLREDLTAAIGHARKLVELEPANIHVACVIATLLAETGDYAAAKSLLREALDRPNNSAADKAKILDGLACIPIYYGIASELAEAEGYIRTAMSYSPRAITLESTLASILLAQGRADEAEPILKRVLNVSEDATDHAIANACLAKIAHLRGQHGDVQRLLANALRAAPRATFVNRVASELRNRASVSV